MDRERSVNVVYIDDLCLALLCCCELALLESDANEEGNISIEIENSTAYCHIHTIRRENRQIVSKQNENTPKNFNCKTIKKETCSFFLHFIQ